MLPSLLELSAQCRARGGSCGGDAGSAGCSEATTAAAAATAAAGEVFPCFLGVDCFLGDRFGAVLPGAGAWKVAFSAWMAWVCCLASWMAAASLGSDALFFTVCVLLKGRVGVW